MIAYGTTRKEAIDKMLKALRETVVLGLQTNKLFLQQCLLHTNFVSGDFNTHFIQDHLPHEVRQRSFDAVRNDVTIAGLLYGWALRQSQRTLLKHVPSGWRNNFYRNQKQEFMIHGQAFELEYRYLPVRAVPGSKVHHHKFYVKAGDEELDVILFNNNNINNNNNCGDGSGAVDFSINGVRRRYLVEQGRSEELFIHSDILGDFVLAVKSRWAKALQDEAGGDSGYVAQMPGKILHLMVEDGKRVQKGEALIVMESMKMESKVSAHKDGQVTLRVREGQIVQAGTLLLSIE